MSKTDRGELVADVVIVLAVELVASVVCSLALAWIMSNNAKSWFAQMASQRPPADDSEAEVAAFRARMSQWEHEQDRSGDK